MWQCGQSCQVPPHSDLFASPLSTDMLPKVHQWCCTLTRSIGSTSSLLLQIGKVASTHLQAWLAHGLVASLRPVGLPWCTLVRTAMLKLPNRSSKLLASSSQSMCGKRGSALSLALSPSWPKASLLGSTPFDYLLSPDRWGFRPAPHQRCSGRRYLHCILWYDLGVG